MTTDEARKALDTAKMDVVKHEHAYISKPTEATSTRSLAAHDAFSKSIDALIAAVRAETLAPAMRLQSHEVSEAQDQLNAAAEHPQQYGYKLACSCRLVSNELTRLRDALADAEASVLAVGEQRNEEISRVAELEEALDDLRACLANHQEFTRKLQDAHVKLEAENAELRKLCGIAAARCYETVDFDEREVGIIGLIAALEAAARRAGK